MDPVSVQQHASALGALRVLRRGWWIILLCAAIVTAAAIAIALREDEEYQASAQVLLNYDNLASGIAGIDGGFSGVSRDPERIALTQTQIAMTPAVAERVAAAKPVRGLTAAGALGSIRVRASNVSDILDFQATWPDGEGARAIANEYARQYVRYRQTLDTTALVAARKQIAGRIEELRESRLRRSRLVAQLVEDEQRLRTMEALQTANASVLREAGGAVQIQPKPRRAAMLGVVLGLMLGVALAFARKALDTRVTSAAEIGERLGLPLLGRIPEPPRKLRSGDRLVMLSNRTGPDAEAFRILRTNLDFVNLDPGARSIMITSALDEEGKSTTIANLAIAFMRAGRRVVLVDLDLRKPAIGRLFGAPSDVPGLTNVLLGSVDLQRALRPVLGGDLDFGGASDGPNGSSGAVGNGRESASGSLTILPSGLVPPDPGEFIATASIPNLVRELTERFDLVLIDSPSLLSAGDARVISASTDAMVVIARLRTVRRATVEELRRGLGTCPTLKLGYVVTGAELEDEYGYGGYEERFYYPGAPARRREQEAML
jgi:Mrp family chromosome partitioning ATPase/capsular polysaccharide biosynthesis protein